MGMHLGLIGLLVLAYALLELLWTAFLEGGAPLTTRVCHYLAKGLLVIQRRCVTRRFIATAGLAAAASTVIIWSLLLWIGWTLVFCSSPAAVVDAATNQPAGCLDRIYYTGVIVSTVGLGDFRPTGMPYKLATSVAGWSGLVLFGLAIAYLVPITSAATQKRQLALNIWSLGKSPDDIIIRAWNGVDTTALSPHLVSLTSMLALLGESHLTYPALHYFHATQRSSSVAARVASLDEALTILECGLQKGCSLHLPSFGAARESITQFLQTLKPAMIAPAKDVPPIPSLRLLRDMGVPVVDNRIFEAALQGMADRRRLLLALVRNEGWTWEEVWPPQGDTSFKPGPVETFAQAAKNG